jgi:hypothetical protein
VAGDSLLLGRGIWRGKEDGIGIIHGKFSEWQTEKQVPPDGKY